MSFSSEQLGAWVELAVNWGLQIVGAAVILLAGWVIAAWVARSDFFAVKIELIKRIKQRFDAEGISIPFPQRDVHLFPAESTAPATESEAAD